jgi:hypothetical protein
MPSKWREELESTNPLDALRRTGGGPKQVEPVRTMADEQPQTIAIDQIMPDPAQARRAMPDDLRTAWLSGAAPAEVFKTWNERAVEEEPVLNQYWTLILNPPNIDQPVEDDELNAINFDRSPAARQWMQLVRLAADILASGLQQRVAVYEVEDGYRLLFGERRYLAYHFLTWQNKEGFDAIPAGIVERYDPIAQALENGSREDLNAIERARQLAIILRTIHDGPIAPDTARDWGWYAEAADAGQYRIPYGKSDLIARAVGLKYPRHVRFYRNLLRLSDEAAALADAYNIEEGALRKIMADEPNPVQVYRILRQHLGLDPAQPQQKPPVSPVRLADKAYGAVQRVAQLDSDAIRQMPPQQRERLRTLLEMLIKRL